MTLDDLIPYTKVSSTRTGRTGVIGSSLRSRLRFIHAYGEERNGTERNGMERNGLLFNSL